MSAGGWFVRDVIVERVDSYRITVAPNLVDAWPERLSTLVDGERARVWVVSDANVWETHGHRLRAAPGADRLIGGVHLVAPGEASKSIGTWRAVLERLVEFGVRRRDLVLAFGGSMVSDLTGFAAATFMRGVRYVNVPTTLLAQVDGSVGGKVAVNSTGAKNLIGAFHHPSAVLVDPTLLRTLPQVELSNGLAELIKSFAIAPDGLFPELVDRIPACLAGQREALRWVVERAVTQKMDLVDPDPYERDLNRALNFGHTLGHAIETYHHYLQIRHGFAVAIGMASAVRLGLNRGITSASAGRQILQAISLAGLPDRLPSEHVEGVVARTRAIAAIRDGKLRFVIPVKLGEVVYCDDITSDELAKAAVG